MNGVLFGKKHSYDDWGLILTQKAIGMPTPKTSSVDIEGADGSLDTTEVLGEVRFTNRTLAFEFTLSDEYEDFNDVVTEIANYIHGRKFKIIIDEDDSYYYIGRASINNFATDKRIGKIVIYCDCEPYKYHLRETIVTKEISGTKDVCVKGFRKTATPVIRCTAPTTLVYKGITYQLEANKDIELLDVFLYEGDNWFKVTTNGVITFTFQGGDI